jgi:Protein of unknown function (DUF3180)
VKPTSIGLVVAVAAAFGAICYAIVSLAYDALPPLPLYGAATVCFLAVAELFTASSVRARLRGHPGTKRIDPLAVARLVALAKASAYAGALAFGAYGAFFGYTLQQLDNPHKAHDAAASGIGVAGSVLLTVAALLLERVCRVPGPPDDEPPDDRREWDPLADWHRDHRHG